MLIIRGYWGEIHGLFYPDGTVRDPAAIAAVMGLYRNRDLNTITEREKIVATMSKADGLGTDFTRTFPLYSASVLILKGKYWGRFPR